MIPAATLVEGEHLNVKYRKWIVFSALLVTALLLGGCGVAGDGVDVATTPPDGWWQTLVVWPLAKALIWLNDFLENANIPYHWGWAIVLFTVIVKVVTFPLTLMQIRGMEAQKQIQPKIQELQKKYGNDREKMSQAQMKLYQEAGVNPLSGCLPLIATMPILFGLYSALVALGPNLDNSRWFWIPDLGFPKYTAGLAWISEAFNGGEYGTLAAYLVLPILLMASQFVMQKWMTPTPAATSDSSNPMAGMTKQMTLIMTFMFGFFTLQVPSGLTLYWVTSNLLQMLQQWAITSDRFSLTNVNLRLPESAAATSPAGGSTAAIQTAEVAPVQAKNNSDTPKKRPKRRRAKRK